MAIERGQRYTAEEFLASRFGGDGYELWYGEIIALAAPGVVHQRIIRKLCYRFDSFISANGGSCEPVQSPFDVVLGDDVVVQPDVSVICDPSKLDGKRCSGAPELVVEVVSNDRARDYSTKLELYRSKGVREYWIIDPERERTVVYTFDSAGELTGMDIYTFDRPVPVGIWDGRLEIAVGELIK